MPENVEIRTLLKSIRRIARALDIHSRRIDREVGLTLPQLIVLHCVRDLGEVTSRTVSEEADLSPATVVGILDKLEEKRLVERYRSVVDRRVVHTRLTPAGAALLSQAPAPLGEAFAHSFLDLPPRRRGEILDAFREIDSMVSAPVDETPFAQDQPRRTSMAMN